MTPTFSAHIITADAVQREQQPGIYISGPVDDNGHTKDLLFLPLDNTGPTSDPDPYSVHTGDPYDVLEEHGWRVVGRDVTHVATGHTIVAVAAHYWARVVSDASSIRAEAALRYGGADDCWRALVTAAKADGASATMLAINSCVSRERIYQVASEPVTSVTVIPEPQQIELSDPPPDTSELWKQLEAKGMVNDKL